MSRLTVSKALRAALEEEMRRDENVILIGEDEIAENVVAVKNMQSGNQEKLSFADAAALIKKDMDERAKAAVIKE